MRNGFGLLSEALTKDDGLNLRGPHSDGHFTSFSRGNKMPGWSVVTCARIRWTPTSTTALRAIFDKEFSMC
jgi:hypothetical protein